MKLDIGTVQRDTVPRQDAVMHPAKHAVDRPQQIRLASQHLGRLAHDQPLQRDPCLDDLCLLAFAEFDNARPPIRGNGQDSLRLQDANGFSDGHAAGTESLGQFGFDQSLARAQFTAGNHSDDTVGHLLGQGARGRAPEFKLCRAELSHLCLRYRCMIVYNHAGADKTDGDSGQAACPEVALAARTGHIDSISRGPYVPQLMRHSHP